MTTLDPNDMDRLLQRICGEYMEMPGLRLSAPQAERLWGLDAPTCQLVLECLVDVKFLHRTPDGRFARLTDGTVKRAPLRMAKAQMARTSSIPRSA